MSQSKADPENAAPNPQEAPAPVASEQPTAPRDATRAEKDEIVNLNLLKLCLFKNHPFGIRDDAEIQEIVESVRVNGVNLSSLVRPTKDAGYDINFADMDTEFLMIVTIRSAQGVTDMLRQMFLESIK